MRQDGHKPVQSHRREGTILMNMDSIVGKVIAGKASDTGENLAWIVDTNSAPNLVEVARLLARYNGKHVRLTIQEEVRKD